MKKVRIFFVDGKRGTLYWDDQARAFTKNPASLWPFVLKHQGIDYITEQLLFAYEKMLSMSCYPSSGWYQSLQVG